MATFEERRAVFGDKLRGLRARSGMNGRDFATALGTGQPKISKIETGRQTPSDEDVPAWCDALEVAEADTRALLAELADLRVEQATWQRHLRSGHRARQDEIQALEQSVAASAPWTSWPCRVSSRPLTTPAGSFTTQAELHDVDRDIDEAVLARMRRQQVLYEPGRSIEILLAEAALRHPVGTPEETIGQVDRLISVIGLPSVRLGILLLDRRLPSC